MIDIHCHLLPGLDDGPATLDEALALAGALVADGITHVVATPHVFPGRFDNRRSGIGPAAQALQQALAQAGLPLQLRWAGEVRLAPEALDLLGAQELPWLGDAAGLRTLLLEMPDNQVPLGALAFVGALQRQGITPVLAHPERNRGVMESLQRLRPFVEAGCKVQVTAGSLVGQFGAKAQATAEALLEQGWVHALASDAHNLRGRVPRMGAARQWLAEQAGADFAHELTVRGPARLCGWAEALPAGTASTAGRVPQGALHV